MNMLSNPVLTDFRPAEVSRPVSQRITLEVLAHEFAKAYRNHHGIHDRDGARQVLRDIRDKFSRYAVSPEQIKRRQLVLFPRLRDIRIADGGLILSEPQEKHLRIFRDSNDSQGMDLKERHHSYGKIVGDCLDEIYAGANAPDDLIHVTCSGYLAPSPAERVVADKQWFDTTVTNSYHMGCYGAFPAIRMAHGFLASSYSPVTPPKQRVDIVHTELLSGHYNLLDLSPENIVTSTLFADGFIRYSVCTESYAREQGLSGLRILGFKERLLPDSAEAMTWVPASHQFQMTLSLMVPVVIKRHVRSFVISLLDRIGMDFAKDKPSLHFAIHPGGPKIVDLIQGELGLRDDQVAVSKTIFLENGNMSSATVPYILKNILEETEVRAGTRIVSLGFGPGLTMTGLVLEKR